MTEQQTTLETPAETQAKLSKVKNRKRKPTAGTKPAQTYLDQLAAQSQKNRQESLQIYRDSTLAISRGEQPAVTPDKMPALLSYLGLTEQQLADDIDRAKKIAEFNALQDDADIQREQLPKLLKVNQDAHEAFVIAEEKAAQSLIAPEALVDKTFQAHKQADELVKRASNAQPPVRGDVDEEYQNLFPDHRSATSPIRLAQNFFAKKVRDYGAAVDARQKHDDQIPSLKASLSYWVDKRDRLQTAVAEVKRQEARLAESFCEFTGLFFPTDPPSSYRVSSLNHLVRIPGDQEASAAIDAALSSQKES